MGFTVCLYVQSYHKENFTQGKDSIITIEVKQVLASDTNCAMFLPSNVA